MASDADTINELVEELDDGPTAELEHLTAAVLSNLDNERSADVPSQTRKLERQIDDALEEIALLKSELKVKNELIDIIKRENKELREPQVQIVSRQTVVSNGVDRADSPPDNASQRLLISIDDDTSTEFEIGSGRVNIGSSSDNDIQLKSSFISRHHAQITNSSNKCILGDLNSTNGTYVNSYRIKKHALREGDSVIIGDLRFKFASNAA